VCSLSPLPTTKVEGRAGLDILGAKFKTIKWAFIHIIIEQSHVHNSKATYKINITIFSVNSY
jgi:hypothetical protein